MKTYKLPKDKFPNFINFLSNKGNLYGPVKQKDQHSFEQVNEYSEMDFNYQRTILGIKKFLTPPRYITQKFDSESVEDIFPQSETNIVLGIHPCDIHAVKILDKLFLDNIKDPYYESRRNNLILVGHSCLPDKNCICQSTGTDIVEDGFDLFLTELENHYLVWVGSSKGLYLIASAENLFSEDITKEDIAEYIRWQKSRSEMFETSIPFKYMPDIIHLNYDSDVWDEFGDKCLSCGVCSLVCPTCNCFNVEDKIVMSADKGVRERMLDSCTLPGYSLVAGGHDFRPNRTQRIKLYYTHKLKEYIGKWGQPACVGCGRCVSYCPVDINVVTISQALFSDVYEEMVCDNNE